MKVHILSVKNLLCPMPVIKVQDYIKCQSKGYYLDVLCTDPGAKIDIPMWCRINGYEICEIKENLEEIRIRIQVI